jgi:protein tyrosine/serine phosphatase
MRIELRLLAVVILAVACLAPAVNAQNSARYEELPNFHKVSANLYRGAQPKAGGLRRLAQLGIKTIVNLRAADDHAKAEESEALALGLRYFNVPLHRQGRPSDGNVERVLKIIDAPENQPVFVHCKRGADRTGTIIAVYRISHDGWTSEQAKAEANRYGMRPWQLGMKSYIHDYYQRRRKRACITQSERLIFIG